MMPKNYGDLSGRRFGRLVVKKQLARSKKGARRWLCVCDCGNTCITRTDRLINCDQTNRSCGCLRSEQNSIRETIHGQTHTPEHRTWLSMLCRCRAKKGISHRLYVARGIKVCERWQGTKGFINFLADMGKRPSPNHSLDRYPDALGDYEPGNCRWATSKEQSHNRADFVRLTAFGESLPACQWAEKVGISSPIIRTRIRHGWSVERALTEPVCAAKSVKRGKRHKSLARK